jgi:hypothetical protein
MRSLAIPALLLSWAVCAADFRAIDLGSPCASVRELEKERGSVPIPWKEMEGGELYAFSGREFDRDVTILYFCIDGHLFTGNYYFPFEDLDQAVKSYGEAHDSFEGTFGRPFLDSSPWVFRTDPDLDPRAVSSDPARYMTTWKTSRARVTLSLMSRDTKPDRKWQVFIVVSPLDPKARSNNALEQTRDE